MVKSAYYIGIMVTLLLLMGCSEEPDTRTAKEKALDAMLHELENCNGAFGDNSYTAQRESNTQYCAAVLGTVERLIQEGYFDEDSFTQGINSAKNFTESATAPSYEEIDSITSDIIGDI